MERFNLVLFLQEQQKIQNDAEEKTSNSCLGIFNLTLHYVILAHKNKDHCILLS
jgi:hypothetical protein